MDKKEDPEDQYSCGSSSNPSEDNFDQNMILEKVYEINNSTTTQEEKLRRQSRFMDDLLN